MSDEFGVRNHYNDTDATGWFVGIIVALALLAIGYLVFSARAANADLAPDQVRCMIANPGKECIEVTRWEPSHV